MAIEVFNRYEKKYMLDEHTFRRLLERINIILMDNFIVYVTFIMILMTTGL